MKKHFINLTNGIEFIPELDHIDGYIRIQSTACEQKHWDKIIQDLDYNFLINVVLGHECIIYDCGANKNTPRALYQGIAWIEYCLNRRILQKENNVFVRKSNCTNYFAEIYNKLDKKTKIKIDYVAKFLNTDHFRIVCISKSTENDSNLYFYKNILIEANK